LDPGPTLPAPWPKAIIRRSAPVARLFCPEWREFAQKAIYNLDAVHPWPTPALDPARAQVQEALQQEQTAGPFMFRILKALVTLILFAFLGLVAYAYLGDLQPVRTDVSQPVELNVDQ
jgi:hypothetical protein